MADRAPGWLVSGLLLALALSGCTSQPPTLATIEELDRTLEPGGFVEVNLEMNETARLETVYEANGSLAWDVHSHREGEVDVHANGTGPNGTLGFEAPRAGTFSLLWENTGQTPVAFSATIRGQARVVSVVP